MSFEVEQGVDMSAVWVTAAVVFVVTLVLAGAFGVAAWRVGPGRARLVTTVVGVVALIGGFIGTSVVIVWAPGQSVVRPVAVRNALADEAVNVKVTGPFGDGDLFNVVAPNGAGCSVLVDINPGERVADATSNCDADKLRGWSLD